MKREILRLVLLVTVGSFFVAGCASHRYEPVVSTTPTGEVIVTQAPPAPRQEVITTAPSTQHVWVQGYWMYRNGRWVWIPGHYEARPRVNANYVAGHWDRTSRGWVWTPGHWE